MRLMKQGVERVVAQFEGQHAVLLDEIEWIRGKRHVVGITPYRLSFQTTLNIGISDFRFIVQEAVVEFVVLAEDGDARRKRRQFGIDDFLDDGANDGADSFLEESTNCIANRVVASFDRGQIAGAIDVDSKLTQVRLAIDRLSDRLGVGTSCQLIRRVQIGVDDRRSVAAGHFGRLHLSAV